MAYIKTTTPLIFFFCLFLQVSSFAGNRVKLLPLEPLPIISSVIPYKANPRRPGYNMRGKIDYISGNEIVINDALRFLTSSTKFFSRTDNAASKRILKPGNMVAFKLDEKNRILKIKVIKK